jgi:uncharacterized protein (DUF1697 family)
MLELKKCLEALGFTNVTTYIASGNAIIKTDKKPAEVKALVEHVLPTTFKLDSELIKVLVLTYDQLKAIVDNRPKGFGDQPDMYHSDAIFLMDLDIKEAMPVFSPREGVDAVWPGIGVVYSQRLSSERTKSRLGKVIGTPVYKSMTIRSWNTTTKLLDLLKAAGQADA